MALMTPGKAGQTAGEITAAQLTTSQARRAPAS